MTKPKRQAIVKPFKRHAASKFTKELGDTICKRISEGESLNKICADKGMPSTGSVCDWVLKGSETGCGDLELSVFAENYRRARLIQMLGIADRLVDIAENDSRDTLPDGRPNNVRVQRDKLISDNLKWVAARLAPQIYGETIKQEHSGPGGGPVEVDYRDLARTMMEVLDGAALEIASNEGK